VPQLPFLSTDEINTFADRYVIPTIVDQRYQAKPTLGILRSKKRLCLVDGGSIIAQPILAQPNQTAITYAGADLLPTDAQNEFTSAQVPWKQMQVSITIVAMDKLRASGRHAQLDLVKNKVESAYMAIFDLMGSQVYANGTGHGGKDWDGLGAGVNNAAGYQNYLGLDRVANPWWQAQIFDPGTPTALSTANMMTLWMACKTDEERIHFITATKTGFASFWGLLTPQEWFVDDELGNYGFKNIAFQGSPVLDDSSQPANTMNFHNIDHEKLYLHRERNFDFDGFNRPINQDVDTAHIFCAGNFIVRKPSATGQYRNISNG